MEDIQNKIKAMTLEEKAGLCSGLDIWHTKPVERAGIPSVMMTDGPHGLRKQEAGANPMNVGDSVKAVCFPTAPALASSFDRELLYRVRLESGASKKVSFTFRLDQLAFINAQEKWALEKGSFCFYIGRGANEKVYEAKYNQAQTRRANDDGSRYCTETL